MMNIMPEALNAKHAQNDFKKLTEENRNNAILAIAKSLEENKDLIIEENEKDLQAAVLNNLNEAMIDRLKLTSERIDSMIATVRSIAAQKEVVGEIIEESIREDGLRILKERVSLGVIGMIFESRPNVVIDCSCLAIKSGNCIILKGGKEANESNNILAGLVQKAIAAHIPENVVQLIHSRKAVGDLLNQVGYVDVIIPRGGENLINYVYDNSQIPVIAHFKGLCHVFVDESANLEQALEIIINSKTQRPGVCNAMETLILHENLSDEFKSKVINELHKRKTELRVDEQLYCDNKNLKIASEKDWATEYLDNILSIKVVSNVEEAIIHIQKYGAHHTEAILSQKESSILKFRNQIDASSIMVNASTRFNDGGEYGLGAELGISTTKLHAYGPMGTKEMTVVRYVVIGKGHIRN